MESICLRSLQNGDREAWDQAFRWLWPVVFSAAKLKLGDHFLNEIEDIAIEALEDLIEKVGEVKDVGELKPLAACIARNKAVNFLRARLAQKRGGGKIASLDETSEDGEKVHDAIFEETPLDVLDENELFEKVRLTMRRLRPPQGEILADFYIGKVRYEEIARRHNLALGSVGVYLKRGLEAFKDIWMKT